MEYIDWWWSQSLLSLVCAVQSQHLLVLRSEQVRHQPFSAPRHLSVLESSAQLSGFDWVGGTPPILDAMLHMLNGGVGAAKLPVTY